MKIRKWNISQRKLIISGLALCYTIFMGFNQLHDDGQVGATKKNGFGCTCHGLPESPEVNVWIEGPLRVQKGAMQEYVLLMTGGPAVAGGYNVAAQRGLLTPADTTSQLLPSTDGLELTHVVPKLFVSDTVRWTFFYQAPLDTTEDTLFSVGNSADGNGVPPGDKFNFGENFIVDLFGDSSTSVVDENIPSQYNLLQNYPNPFNPETKIGFKVQVSGFTSLKIYDMLGKEIAVIVSGYLLAGEYQMEWNAHNVPSGLYFYRLTSGNFSQTKKMVLLK